jgi:hypothetical protein
MRRSMPKRTVKLMSNIGSNDMNTVETSDFLSLDDTTLTADTLQSTCNLIFARSALSRPNSGSRWSYVEPMESDANSRNTAPACPNRGENVTRREFGPVRRIPQRYCRATRWVDGYEASNSVRRDRAQLGGSFDRFS